MVKKSNKKQRMDFIKYIDAILNTPNLDDKMEFLSQNYQIKTC